jgi:hypothetical protein
MSNSSLIHLQHFSNSHGLLGVGLVPFADLHNALSFNIHAFIFAFGRSSSFPPPPFSLFYPLLAVVLSPGREPFNLQLEKRDIKGFCMPKGERAHFG